MSSTTLVVGATGSVGAAVVQELLARGRAVHALCRDAAAASRLLGEHALLRVFEGDAQHYGDILRAAERCDVIVHAICRPLHLWEPDLETAMKVVIAACEASSATLLWPDGLLAYGNQTRRPLDELSPPLPCSEKGRLRLRMESDVRRAVEEGRIRAIVLRSGDVYGPTVRNRRVDGLFRRASEGRSLLSLVRLGVAHQWAYAPDLAGVVADLIDREADLDPFETIHFEGHTARPQRDFCRAIAAAAGNPRQRAFRYPWIGVRMAGFIDPEMRALAELRYTLEQPVLIEGRRFRALFPEHRLTPLHESLEITLGSYRDPTT